MKHRAPPPHYEETTHGIRITVQPKFMHDESSLAKSQFMWAYAVHIENQSDRTWTLTHRHWRIIDSAGRTQSVDGEGVVGQTPTLQPGEDFSYSSGCPLSTPSGMMSGSYDFVDEEGKLLKAKIPTFSLDSPHEKQKPS